MLVTVLVMVAPVCAVVLSPVVFTLSAATQLYDEAMLLVSASPTAVPLQIVFVAALVIEGVGFTVTETVCGVPAQLPAVDVGVTV